MTNFARVTNNVAVDVAIDPASSFHPDIAAQFEPVPDAVKPGWIRTDGGWAPPTPEPEPGPVYPQLSPVQFKMLFTSQERVAIKAARGTDPVVDDFFELVEDPRLTYVDLALQSVQDAVGYLAQQGLIAPERVPEILSGTLR